MLYIDIEMKSMQKNKEIKKQEKEIIEKQEKNQKLNYQFNKLKNENKELFNFLKAEFKKQEKAQKILKKEFSNMQIDKHNCIYFKRDMQLSLEKFANILKCDNLKMIINEEEKSFKFIKA